MMKELQFYKIATVGLLLLNLSLIAFFFINRPPRQLPPPKEGRERANEALKLDRKQHEVFLQYANQHMQTMRSLDNQQRDLLRPYFTALTDQQENNYTDSLLNQVLQIERNKIETTYEHFQTVRSILRPDQEPYFEDWVNSALKNVLMENKGPLPPKEK